MVVIFHGLAIQSFGVDGDKHQIWQDDNTPKDHALYMRDKAPEFQELSSYWRVKPLPDLGENVYKITGFPSQNRKDGSQRGYKDYRPVFLDDYTIDSLILTRSEKSDFLDGFWTPNGLSSHIILAQDGTAFIHAHPLWHEKGQMAGKWNSRSLEVAFIDHGDQILSSPQQATLKNLLGIFQEKSSNIDVRYGGSIWEAKQLDNIPGFESGHVHNIEEVRDFLNLSQLTL